MSKELVDWAKSISKNHNLNFDQVIAGVEEALAVTVRRKYEGERLYRVSLNKETGDTEIFRQWKVVTEVNFPTKEVSLEASLLEEPNIQVGDVFEEFAPDEQIPTDRISFTTFRQLMQNKIREIEKLKIIEAYTPKIGQIVNGHVKRSQPGSITVILPDEASEPGKSKDPLTVDSNVVEGIIKKDGLIPTEKFRNNTPIKALLVGSENDMHKNQLLILSRTHPDFLKELLKKEVPEIENGQIEVVAIAREPGYRAKVAVRSNDRNLDVLGACIGLRSTRINAVVQELSGERIDIIEWSDDFPTYIKNALNQPEVDKIVIDENKRTIELSVPDEFLSSAIGRAGVNVRLASKLLNWKIKVYEKEKFDHMQEVENDRLVTYFTTELDLDKESALYLIEQGFQKVDEIAATPLEELEEFLEHDQAVLLQKMAQDRLNAVIDAQLAKIEASGIDERILALDGIDNEIVINLIEMGVKTLEDLADLAQDELTDIMAASLADSLIMQARDICWFNGAEE